MSGVPSAFNFKFPERAALISLSPSVALTEATAIGASESVKSSFSIPTHSLSSLGSSLTVIKSFAPAAWAAAAH